MSQTRPPSPCDENRSTRFSNVWVLHHVGDLAAALSEAHRVLRPHGRLISVSGISHSTHDPMSSVFERLDDQLRPERRDQAMAVAQAGVNAGFVVAHQGTAPTTGSTSPNALADSMAARHFSHLWDLTASKWERLVEPAIDELRSLPNPDQIRQRTFQHPLVVLAKQ